MIHLSSRPTEEGATIPEATDLGFWGGIRQRIGKINENDSTQLLARNDQKPPDQQPGKSPFPGHQPRFPKLPIPDLKNLPGLQGLNDIDIQTLLNMLKQLPGVMDDPELQRMLSLLLQMPEFMGNIQKDMDDVYRMQDLINQMLKRHGIDDRLDIDSLMKDLSKDLLGMDRGDDTLNPKDDTLNPKEELATAWLRG